VSDPLKLQFRPNKTVQTEALCGIEFFPHSTVYYFYILKNLFFCIQYVVNTVPNQSTPDFRKFQNSKNIVKLSLYLTTQESPLTW
jgi:hypothetical protein